MREVPADEVAIDAFGRLIVHPKLPPGEDFAFIYRAAMEVGWDPAARSLVGPAPRDWSSTQWFSQIADALRSEYGRRLVVCPNTRWRDVPAHIRAEIEARFGQKPAV